jgi:hypothetical protein
LWSNFFRRSRIFQLNDKERNSAYQNAISNAITKLGSGDPSRVRYANSLPSLQPHPSPSFPLLLLLAFSSKPSSFPTPPLLFARPATPLNLLPLDAS